LQVFQLASADLVLDVEEELPIVGEVQEVIKFMGVDGAEYKDVEEIVAVDPRVISQLKELVTEIAKNYKVRLHCQFSAASQNVYFWNQNNAFHNLAHGEYTFYFLMIACLTEIP
jgi:hypothetical protein